MSQEPVVETQSFTLSLQERKTLLTISQFMREQGLLQLRYPYDGHAGEGGLRSPAVDPKILTVRHPIMTPREMLTRSTELLWELLEQWKPEWIEGLGGHGDITWDLQSGRIEISHHKRIVSYRTSACSLNIWR